MWNILLFPKSNPWKASCETTLNISWSCEMDLWSFSWTVRTPFYIRINNCWQLSVFSILKVIRILCILPLSSHVDTDTTRVWLLLVIWHLPLIILSPPLYNHRDVVRRLYFSKMTEHTDTYICTVLVNV